MLLLRGILWIYVEQIQPVQLINNSGQRGPQRPGIFEAHAKPIPIQQETVLVIASPVITDQFAERLRQERLELDSELLRNILGV